MSELESFLAKGKDYDSCFTRDGPIGGSRCRRATISRRPRGWAESKSSSPTVTMFYIVLRRGRRARRLPPRGRPAVTPKMVRALSSASGGAPASPRWSTAASRTTIGSSPCSAAHRWASPGASSGRG
eukprot:1311649-Pyramimonas_sp.AAC.1